MFEFFTFLGKCFDSIFSMLDNEFFTFKSTLGATFSVSLGDLLIGFICMGLIISVFWKGART